MKSSRRKKTKSVEKPDLISGLPGELKRYIATNFLSIRDAGHLTQASKMWRHQVCIYEEIYKGFFPREHAVKSDPEYRKLVGPVNWRFELIFAFHQYCSHLTNDQMIGYFQARRCNFVGIRRIALENNRGLLRLFAKDNQGEYILHFLAQYEGKDRKAIYDFLFSQFLKSYERTVVIDPAVKARRLRMHQQLLGMIGLEASEFQVFRNQYVRTLLGENVTSTKLLSLTEFTILILMALQFNQELAFFGLVDNVGEHGSIFGILNSMADDLQKIQIKLSPQFANRLFQFLCNPAYFPLEDQNSPAKLLEWIIRLDQRHFIDNEYARKVLSVSDESYASFPLAVRNAMSTYDMINAVRPKEIRQVFDEYALLNAIRNNEVKLVADICAHLVVGNICNLYTIHNFISGMYEAIRTGHLDCLLAICKAYGGCPAQIVGPALKHENPMVIQLIETHYPEAIHDFILIKNYPANQSWLEFSSAEINVFIIRFLIRHGADLRRFDNSGLNYLHKICMKDEDMTTSIKCLVEAGIDPNAETVWPKSDVYISGTANAIAARTYDRSDSRSLKNCMLNIVALTRLGADPYIDNSLGLSAMRYMSDAKDVEWKGKRRSPSKLIEDEHHKYLKKQAKRCSIQ